MKSRCVPLHVDDFSWPLLLLFLLRNAATLEDAIQGRAGLTNRRHLAACLRAIERALQDVLLFICLARTPRMVSRGPPDPLSMHGCPDPSRENFSKLADTWLTPG